MKVLSLTELQSAVAGTAAAFRCRTEYQPVGGEGDKVFSTDLRRRTLCRRETLRRWSRGASRLCSSRLGAISGEPNGTGDARRLGTQAPCAARD